MNKISLKWLLLITCIVVPLSVAAQAYYNITYASISSSTIDSTPIGQSTPAAGAFTTLSSNGKAVSGSGTVIPTLTVPSASGSLICSTDTVGSMGACSAGSKIEFATTSTGCTTGSSSYDVCTMSVTFSPGFSSSTYGVACSGINPTDGGNPTSGRAVQNGVTSQTATSVTVQFATQGSNSISYSGMTCVGVGN